MHGAVHILVDLTSESETDWLMLRDPVSVRIIISPSLETISLTVQLARHMIGVLGEQR